MAQQQLVTRNDELTNDSSTCMKSRKSRLFVNFVNFRQCSSKFVAIPCCDFDRSPKQTCMIKITIVNILITRTLIFRVNMSFGSLFSYFHNAVTSSLGRQLSFSASKLFCMAGWVGCGWFVVINFWACGCSDAPQL